nr:DeoR/GlpR transcriptional regulator [Clostridia bacterium]PZN09634.1 MAG: DeoR/GlpR transcriptional regulator [Caldicoprobacter oshimai]
MFAIERLNKIKEILLKEKRVDVIELSQLFSVTEVTIRRDLDKLEKEGFAIKTYGGAVLNENIFQQSSSFEYEEKDNIEENKMIGKIAAEMVEDNEAIYLSPGRACFELTRHLKSKNLTVVTNDLAIAYELKNKPGLKVIVTGGTLIHSTTTLVGEFTLQTLNGIYINKAFINVKGVDFDAGYTLGSKEEIMIIEKIREISKEFIIMADYTKFNRTSFAKLGNLTMAKKIITNKQVPPEYKKFFFEKGIKLYTTFEFK